MSNYLTDHRIIAVSRPDKRINLFIQGGTSSSFVLPKDITAIEEYAFHNISGLTEVVFTNQDVVVEVDENSGIPANAKFIVPVRFLSDYQAKYPNRTVETRGVIWNVPFVGETTLTKAYINQCILQEPEIANAEMVIVPEGFTEYESGAVSAITNAISNLIEIEFLVSQEQPMSFIANIANDSVPNIVSFPNMTFTSVGSLGNIKALRIGKLKNVTHINATSQYLTSFKTGVFDNYRFGDLFGTYQNRTPSLREIDYGDMSSVTTNNSYANNGVFWWETSYEIDIRWSGMKSSNLNLNHCNAAHDGLVYIMEHAYDYSGDLGTHTWTIGATNLAKLSQAEIDAFTVKGWTLQ